LKFLLLPCYQSRPVCTLKTHSPFPPNSNTYFPSRKTMADVKHALVVPDEMRLDHRPVLSVSRGAASAPIAPYTADSYNVSGCLWNTSMPSDTSILDRYVEVGADINVTWTVTATSGTAAQAIMQFGTDFALASRPFARLCTKTEIAVNGTAISFNGALVDALQALEQADDTDAVEYPSLNAVYAQNLDARHLGRPPPW
jgi:hypothetical protein